MMNTLTLTAPPSSQQSVAMLKERRILLDIKRSFEG